MAFFSQLDDFHCDAFCFPKLRLSERISVLRCPEAFFTSGGFQKSMMRCSLQVNHGPALNRLWSESSIMLARAFRPGRWLR